MIEDEDEVNLKKIRDKYPDRVPVKVVCDKHITIVDKTHFLVPKTYTISKFMSVIRNKITMQKHQAIFLLIDNSLPASCELIGNIYDKSDKPYIIIHLKVENTFG